MWPLFSLVVSMVCLLSLNWRGKDTKKRPRQTDQTDQHELRPELWETLPNDLIDVITDKILVDLPFSRLLSFCRVCKRWKEVLLSNHYLIYFHMGKCMLFNSRRDSWESISMDFCQVSGYNLQNLQLVSFIGGLLIFSTDEYDRFIVCNPLTKRWRKLGGSTGGQAPETVLGSRLKVHTTKFSQDPSAFGQMSDPLPFTPSYVNVDIAITLDAEYFMLSLVNFHRGTTQVYESRYASWTQVDYLPEGFRFIVNGPIMLSEGSVALGFGTHGDSFSVLVYDLELKICSWMRTETLLDAMKRMGRSLIATFNYEDQSQLFEVQDTGFVLSLVESALQLPLKTLCKEMFFRIPNHLQQFVDPRLAFSMLCVGQGDIVYYVGVLRGSLEHPFEVFSVLSPNQGGSSDRILKWGVRNTQSVQLPHAVDFHVFKPSMLFLE